MLLNVCSYGLLMVITNAKMIENWVLFETKNNAKKVRFIRGIKNLVPVTLLVSTSQPIEIRCRTLTLRVPFTNALDVFKFRMDMTTQLTFNFKLYGYIPLTFNEFKNSLG